MMIRPMVWRALVLAVFAAGALPGHAADVYQISTISSLLAGGYDGDTSVAELLRHGDWIGDLQWGGREDDGARRPRLPRHDRRPGACGCRLGADPICGASRSSKDLLLLCSLKPPQTIPFSRRRSPWQR